MNIGGERDGRNGNYTGNDNGGGYRLAEELYSVYRKETGCGGTRVGNIRRRIIQFPVWQLQDAPHHYPQGAEPEGN